MLDQLVDHVTIAYSCQSLKWIMPRGEFFLEKYVFHRLVSLVNSSEIVQKDKS